MGAYGSISLYPHLPVGNAMLPVNSMPPFKLMAGTKNNQAGQYMSGDLIISYTGTQGAQSSGKDAIQTFTRRYHSRVSVSNANGAMCIVLMPRNWVSRYSNLTQYDSDMLLATYENEPFTYIPWILYNTTRYAETNKESKLVENIIYADTGKAVDGYPKIGAVGSVSANFWTGGNGFIYGLNNTIYSKIVGPVDYYIYPRALRESIPSQLAALREEYNDFDAVMNVVYAGQFTGFDYVYRPSCQIEASIPIFSWDNLDAVYRYFKFGDADGVNADDLKISDVDFATDWTIYVNGQRSPSIYITMDSKDIDNYLSNTVENTGGYQKSDFKIQYRIPTWQVDMASILVGKDLQSSLKEYELVNDVTGTYNNTRASSWAELTDRNYGNKEGFPTFSGAGGQNERFFEMYAQIQFRVYLTETLYSAWCEIGIGYIGSPSVADFARMQNWGNVVSVDDGSTVTIIYDQLPEDEDDYKKPDDDFPPEDDTEPTGFSLDSALTTTYKVEYNQLQLLGQYLWGATFIDDINLINNSPIENIVSVKRLPFNINAGVARNIVLGNVTTPANGNIVSSIPILNIGTITYSGVYGNFLDYDPFTKLILFLPFCGFITLDASVVTGKSLNVKYAVDIILGKCKAMIYIDGAYYQSVDGDLGIDIPLVASNRASTEAAMVAQGIQAIGGVVSGNLSAALSVAAPPQYHSSSTGSYTPTCAWQETRNCYLIADIPTVQYPSSYGHDIGYPCMLTRTLATMSGFTVCSEDIDMSGFNCTSEEMDMIKQILTTGIYL